jgi:rsbT co-antagonist protein RsbR
LKTVAAARLMGADCIISGIRPQIAQTIVHLGVELGDVVTKASLADAFAVALKRMNLGIQKTKADADASPEAKAGRSAQTEEA